MKYATSTEGLHFSYNKTSRDIQDLNLKIPENAIYGFLGPNGSGKSTTIKLLLGLLKHKQGHIYYGDITLKNNRIQCLSTIGTLIESPSLYDHLTARENLRIAMRYRGSFHTTRIDEVLEIVKLSNTKNKKVKAFSMGMKQRLGIAIALLSKPKLLILDEPTNGLDPKGIQEIRSLIYTLNTIYNTTIFISSHLLSEIDKLCTHVGIIKDGVLIFQDTVENLRQSQDKRLSIELETNDTTELTKLLDAHKIEYRILSDKSVSIFIKNKSEITEIIDRVRSREILIYQIRINNNLEDLFLELTQNV